MNKKLFILDRSMKCVGILDNDLPKGCPYWDDVHTESLDHGLLTLEFKMPANHSLSDQIESEGFIVYPNMDDEYELFRIKEINETSQDGKYIKEIYAENAAVTELMANVIRPVTLPSASVDSAMNYILNGTDWSLGDSVESLDAKDVKFDDYTNSLEALHTIMDLFGFEAEWRVKFDGLKVTDKLINVVEKRGEQTNKRFEYSYDLKDVQRTEDTKELVTALVGISNGDGYGNYLSLRDYTGAVDQGYELHDDWLGSLDALDRFGLNGKHIFGVYRFDGVQNATELYQAVKKKLDELSTPKLTYQASVITLERLTGYEAQKVRLGDYILVIDKTFNPPLIVQARVIELKRSKVDPSQDEVTLGEFKPIFSSTPQVIQKIQQQAAAAMTTAATAQQAADSAQQTATTAQQTASTAQTVASQAQSTANTAQTTATSAQSTANQVKGTVDNWKHQTDTTKIDGAKIYTGTITADQIAAGAIDTTKITTNGLQADTIKGGTLTLGGVNNIKGRLEVQADDQTPIHFIDSTQASFSNAYAGFFKSPTVAFKNSDDYTVFVDPLNGSDGNDGLTASTQLKTLQEAFNRMPDYNDGNITILIASNTGTWSESTAITLAGVHGAGTITIDFQSQTNTLQSRIKIIQCTNQITIKNGTVKNNEVFGSTLSEGCIYIQTCARVILDNMYFDARAGAKLAYCVAVTYNSYCRINNCQCYNGATAQIVSSYGSFADVRNCTGTGGTYGILAVGGVIVGTGNAPGGATNHQELEGGINNAAFSYPPSTAPTAPSTSTTTTTWTATRTASYRTSYGWRSDNDYIYQGQYSGYGNHSGMLFFDDASIRSTLSGKTIKSVRLYLSRRAGGTNSAQYINVYTHNHTTSIIGGSAPTITLAKSNAGAYAVGDKKYISLPTSIGDALKNNTAKGIAIYSSSGSPYMIFDGVNEGSSVTPKLEITYEG